eukprot:COSAG01_NODE_291_length_19378_cov_38.136418_18_plen_112_part_00
MLSFCANQLSSFSSETCGALTDRHAHRAKLSCGKALRIRAVKPIVHADKCSGRVGGSARAAVAAEQLQAVPVPTILKNVAADVPRILPQYGLVSFTFHKSLCACRQIVESN